MGQRSKTGSRKMVDQKIETNTTTTSQQAVWARLRQIVTSNKIGSAYLFSGPPGCGKEGTAIKFSQMLNCEINKDNICENCPSCVRSSKLQHENVKIIFPLPTPKKSSDNEDSGIGKKDIDLVTDELHKKSIDPYHKIIIPMANRILIQSIRELRKNLYLKSESSGRKVVLVFDAHLLSEGASESANALLKILEEPPMNTSLILVTSNKSKLPLTITSRCQQIDFPRLSLDAVRELLENDKVENNKAMQLAILSNGDILLAKDLLSRGVDEPLEEAQRLIDNLIRLERDSWRSSIKSHWIR